MGYCFKCQKLRENKVLVWRGVYLLCADCDAVAIKQPNGSYKFPEKK